MNTSDNIRKLRWIAMAIFAPEIFVYNAWMQREEVNFFTKIARESQRLAEELGMPQAFEWTKYHSWHMIMGGFYFKTDDNGAVDDFIPGSPDLILTTESVDLLTRTVPPLLPQMNAQVIQEPSSAYILVRTLAILQAIYQILSVITRVILKQPVSPLEINTCAHVLFTFAILRIWADKPKNIEVRTQISEEWAKPLCAYLWMSHGLNCSATSRCPELCRLTPLDCARNHEGTGKEEHHPEVEFSNQDRLCEKPQVLVPTELSPTMIPQQANMSTTAHLSTTSLSGWTSWALPRIDPLHDHGAFEEVLRPALKDDFQHPDFVYDNATTANRMCLAMSYIRYWSSNTVNWHNRPIGDQKPSLGVKKYDYPLGPPLYLAVLITDHVSDWFKGSNEMAWYFGKVKPQLSMALLIVCYGCLHASAWNAQFPTQVSIISTLP